MAAVQQGQVRDELDKYFDLAASGGESFRPLEGRPHRGNDFRRGTP